jgi:hypothetical protein
MLFVAPALSGSGPRFLGELAGPLELSHQTAERIGDDVLIAAYLREP